MTNNHDYQQLSDDWRHRDQLTWQLPSVLVVITGALVAIVHEFQNLDQVGNYLLWGCLIFAGLLTIALGQNLYFQTVAEDLMDAMGSGEAVRGSSIPRRREPGPSFVAFIKRGLVKVGSTGLFVLSAGLTGFLGFLISKPYFESETNFILWVGTGIIVVGLTVLINLTIYACHKQASNPPKEEKDNP